VLSRLEGSNPSLSASSHYLQEKCSRRMKKTKRFWRGFRTTLLQPYCNPSAESFFHGVCQAVTYAGKVETSAYRALQHFSFFLLKC
jgi:hypothetical protein